MKLLGCLIYLISQVTLGKSNSPFNEFLEVSLYNPSFTFMDG